MPQRSKLTVFVEAPFDEFFILKLVAPHVQGEALRRCEVKHHVPSCLAHRLHSASIQPAVAIVAKFRRKLYIAYRVLCIRLPEEFQFAATDLEHTNYTPGTSLEFYRIR